MGDKLRQKLWLVWNLLNCKHCTAVCVTVPSVFACVCIYVCVCVCSLCAVLAAWTTVWWPLLHVCLLALQPGSGVRQASALQVVRQPALCLLNDCLVLVLFHALVSVSLKSLFGSPQWLSGFFVLFFFAFPSYISGVHRFWVRFLRMWPFFNPTIKVVTFRLRGWCVLGVFLLPAFTHLRHECQDLLSPCDEMHVCTD